MTGFGRPPRVEAMTAHQRWTALTVLAGSLLVVMMDMTILIMALPELVTELSPTATQQLWIVDVYSLILAGLLIPVSALADRWGRKRVLLAGFALFGIASALVLVTSTPESVIALRALLGAAGAMIMPTTLSMIRTIFLDPVERARALAAWSLIAGLGAIIGPLVGGALLELFSWHAAFLVNVPFVAVALVAGAVLLPEGRDPNPPRWDVAGIALSIAGMAALVWGIKDLGTHGWGTTGAWVTIAVALLALTLFVRRCLSRPDPLLDVRLFRHRPFTAGTVAAFTCSLAMAGALLLVAQWLQGVAGFTPLAAGVALLPMALGSFATAPFAPSLAIRFGARTVLAAGLAVAGVGLLVLFALGGPDAYPQLIAPLALIGMGTGSLAIASAIIMGSTPAARAGSAAAIEESMYDLGNVFGVAVMGSVAAALFRGELDVARFAARGVTGRLAEVANESVVGALTVAEELGLPDLTAAAIAAFDAGIAQASLVGGVLLLLTALAVFALVPARFDIRDAHGGDPEAPAGDAH